MTSAPISRHHGATPAPQQPAPATRMAVVGSDAVADIGRVTVARLAAAAPAESTDPVDLALRASLRAGGEETPVAESFYPATPERRYSLASLRGVEVLGTTTDIAVMRGDVNAVLEAAGGTREERKLMTKAVAAQEKLGRRCMAVATAPLNGDLTGEFRIKGYVVLGAGEAPVPLGRARGGYVHLRTWPVALRIQHWANLLLIIALTLTGYYIMDPYFAVPQSADVGYVMGWIRLVHYISGATWVVLALWRLWLVVTAKTRHMRWRSLWPIYGRDDVKDMFATIQFYLFLRHEEPVHTGHNKLQQFAYTGIYALCAVQMWTGLALWGLPHQDNLFWVIMSYPVHWVGVAGIRLIHAMIMFIIWAFVVLHVYLVFRADSLESHGGLSAMINGGVWLPVGTRPVDGPEVE